MGAYLKSRLLEASTLRGLILLAGGIGGIEISDSDAETLTAAVLVLAGLAGAALPDRMGGKG